MEHFYKESLYLLSVPSSVHGSDDKFNAGDFQQHNVADFSDSPAPKDSMGLGIFIHRVEVQRHPRVVGKSWVFIQRKVKKRHRIRERPYTGVNKIRRDGPRVGGRKRIRKAIGGSRERRVKKEKGVGRAVTKRFRGRSTFKRRRRYSGKARENGRGRIRIRRSNRVRKKRKGEKNIRRVRKRKRKGKAKTGFERNKKKRDGKKNSRKKPEKNCTDYWRRQTFETNESRRIRWKRRRNDHTYYSNRIWWKWCKAWKKNKRKDERKWVPRIQKTTYQRISQQRK